MPATAFTYAENAGHALDQGRLRRAARLYYRAVQQLKLDPPENPETERLPGEADPDWPVYWEASGATCLRIATALGLKG